MIMGKISWPGFDDAGSRINMPIMRCFIILVICLGVLSGCQEDSDFFPLESDLSWNYRVTILPEVEPKELKKIVVSNLHPVTLTQSDDVAGNDEIETFRLTPRLRENNSLYYYFDDTEGIRRVAYQVRPTAPVHFEAQPRYVFKYPLEEGTGWEVPSRTYLLVRRYPLDHDYRVTVDFNMTYQIESVSDTVQVPAGVFKNCLRTRGVGETVFIGDRGLGRVRVVVENIDWFAPDVGLVKTERRESTTTDLFGTSTLLIELENFSG